ncbi:MAG: glutamine--tRNA ligase/YqeY domain fusion protein [Planctomycetes bacterium]|nr:glutamine--tRNA ligase/YqeY domain fusion protein [Planctomycetota bacterium]NOG55975.1 glutamine--tRNA ligase/YqeY domain fusion protein [Planctomycetota bacterium]
MSNNNSTGSDNPNVENGTGPAPARASHFIRDIIQQDLEQGKHGGTIVTRFPPEPNAYLHLGHAKAICINYGLAEDFGGRYHLRFDDTNPTKEEQKYIDAMRVDIHWLGFDWGDHEYYASDYFEQLYNWAVELIEAGKAYVDDQTPEEIRETRGTLKTPGTESPYRNRPVEENLDLFARMKAGEFPNGSRVLRARIDMTSPNLNMRDPVMYRVLHEKHPRTGEAWCIYPMYDYAHGQSDAIEGITHSLCSLEFEDHRPLYDWFLNNIPSIPHKPRQIEFARLNLAHAMMSKRKLLQLVNEGVVDGWDDPRLTTLSGMRRRGYTATAIRRFCEVIGVTKTNSLTEFALLEHTVREDLNKTSARVMAVLNPLKVVIENYPEGQVEHMEAVNNPEDASAGTRQVPFSRTVYIERDDFTEDPPKKWFRLAPGREVRLRAAYWVTCTDVIKDDDGNVVELRCTYDPETKGGNNPPDGRKVKGTLHWVSAEHAVPAEVRSYDHLFTSVYPDDVTDEQKAEGLDWKVNVNPDSLTVNGNAMVEPSLADAEPGTRLQFERIGYFCVDTKFTMPDKLVFNRTATLRDTWAKQAKKG